MRRLSELLASLDPEHRLGISVLAGNGRCGGRLPGPTAAGVVYSTTKPSAWKVPITMFTRSPRFTALVGFENAIQ